ncbi:tetraacyldisaccharide 4'-kinase [Halobacteriovorax sp. XZX-3]|uniref:tetraacyldisaccharide 4'-kinase n=1 Tax=unclassified Halobacteriovorax TaxID=2639665 RepID=UPI0037227B0B
MNNINIKLINFFSVALTPVSFLWEWIYRLRRFAFKMGILKSSSFEVPIISIGNLSLGGTGKTPFTLWIGNYLNDILNKKTMVLTRGYKGELENSSGIIKTGKKISENPFVFGDEALVLSRNLKNASVVVGADRSDNLRRYYEEEKADVVLLDDGFQHLKINRNLNIVLFDSLLPMSKYHCPPRGYLREGVSALREADIVLFGRADLVTEEKLERLESYILKNCKPNTPSGFFKYAPSAIKNLLHEEDYALTDLKGKSVICVSGLASPEAFLKLVKQLDANIVDDFNFPDHHLYKVSELEGLVELAQEKDAIILTTEKDIVKMKRCSSSERIHYLQIGIEFIKGEQFVKDKINSVVRG